jgi:Putative MetA-pathway of phenol degradation
MQHNKAIATSGRRAGRPQWMMAMLAAGGIAVGVDGALAAEGTNNVPDKSQYNLFNPTPDEYMRDISPDRPDKTDSPFTVDAGHFQWEMDFANYTHDAPNSQNGNIKSDAYQVAPMNVKVGVLNDVDVQLVLEPWTWQQKKNETTGAVRTDSGFGDTALRAKVNLTGNDGGFFALALIPYVTLPTAQEDLGAGGVEGGIGIPYAFDVPNWDVGFQTTVSWDRNDFDDGYHADIANSVSIGHAVIGPLEYHVEFYSSVSTEQNSGWVGTFDTWLTYQVNKNLIFDSGVYIGVTTAADNWHPWVGMTWRY